MSRVGRQPITVPEKVAVHLEGTTVRVEGPKGALAHQLPAGIQADLKEKTLTIARQGETKSARALHGLTRTLVNNMIVGVTNGFTKELEIQGVGYKASVEKHVLSVTLRFSHPVLYPIPAGITIETPKPTQVLITGIDKALVGQVAATIRAFFKAEPYKGVGIRYAGEVVRRKAGKSVAKA